MLSSCVQIFDGAFSAGTCELLHASASARGLGHALFARDQPRSRLEFALSSFLDELRDDAPYVEYWSRQEWKHIEAHADVDEARAVKFADEAYRYPHHGHVLYLKVGERVRGPTCVWQGTSDDNDDAAAAAVDKFAGATTVVPAVAGRVLRFDGHLQHAVPRPADVWLAPFVINQSGPPEEFERSVVLFNTWTEPPLDVQPEAVAGGDEASASVRCEPREGWSVAPAEAPPAGPPNKTMKLWLLGDTRRRGQVDRTIPLQVDGDLMSDALEQVRTVTTLQPPVAS